MPLIVDDIMAFNAILFDLGGTLVGFHHEMGSLYTSRLALSDFLSVQGFNVKPKDVFDVSRTLWDTYKTFANATMIELPFSHLMQAMLYRLHINDYANTDLVNEAIEAFYRPLVENSYLLEGSLDLLSRLRCRGSKLGLVTDNESQWFHTKLLAKYGLHRFFHSIIVSCVLGIRKPHEKMFLRCLQDLQVNPSDAVFIGDKLFNDMYGAKNVGLSCIWMKRQPHDNISIQPDWTVHSINEVEKILFALF